MDAGYYDRGESNAAYVQRTKEYAILRKGTPEEQAELKRLWIEASELAGQDWCEYSKRKTTDEGIEKSVTLLVRYRSLLSTIRHREEQSRRSKENE